jgi:hypothetical protein
VVNSTLETNLGKDGISMTMDKALAKSLLDRDEKSLFDVAAGARLNKLTLVELQDYVGRSRQTRDKWSDLVKKQRRASQKKAGQRQTTENARSEQKSQLLQEVHQAFVERLAAVQAGGAEVPAGTKATPIPRKTRKVINRVDRVFYTDDIGVHAVNQLFPSPAQYLTFLEQLLGNVGRFNTPTASGLPGPGGV